MNIIKLTTEGDCEGRTIKTVGYFAGTIEQVITYCVANNIKPYYNFQKNTVEVIDCSSLITKVQVKEDNLGYIKYTTDKDLEKQAAINAALSKLTDKEKELLGINN